MTTRSSPTNNCAVQGVTFPDMETMPKPQRERFEAVQSSIRHAWKGYETTVLDPYRHSIHHILGTGLPADDLEPLTKSGKTWLHAAATLFDSLDTLYIAGLFEEYDRALDLALSLPLPLYPTKTFEYSIRVLGGLLGAYSVSGDKRVLDYAQFVADSMLDGAFRSSPTVLPRMFDVLAPKYGNAQYRTNSQKKRYVRWVDWGGAWMHRLYAAVYRYGRDYTGQHEQNSLAGFGSFALEFAYLSYLTGDERYKEASDDIFQWVQKDERDNGIDERKSKVGSKVKGLIAKQWNVLNGRAVAASVGLGSGSDSYYEYLIKSAILLQPLGDKSVDRDRVQSYVKVMEESFFSERANGLRMKEEVVGGKKMHVTYPVQYGYEYDHLLCFVPGMMILGESFYQEKLEYPSVSGHVVSELAINMTLGCWNTYIQSETKLGPERLNFHKSTKSHTATARMNKGYYLRPEFVESLFVLYRSTRDEKYRDMAWQVFQSLEKYCRHDVGYTSWMDVYSTSRQHKMNEMPSYFIAETLKYLLLIFSPLDYVGLEEYVFTTEAHPLRQVHTMSHGLSTENCERQPPVVHLPISNIFVLGFYTILASLLYIVLRRLRRVTSRRDRFKKML